MSVETTLAKCDHLVETGLWPREQELPYRGWLNNFEGKQKDAAAKILNSFIFINEDMAYSALSSAYRNLIRTYLPNTTDGKSVPHEKILALHKSIIITPIRGETPNPSDSGLTYVRAARDRLGFGESQLAVDIDSAIRLANRSDKIIVLVDDTIGSGTQIETNMRKNARFLSLLKATKRERVNIACLTAVMTSYARNRLAETFPSLEVFAGHILDLDRYGVHSIFPPGEHKDVHDLLQQVSDRLKVPHYVHPVYGFHEFGFILSFHNSIPDFSLPILWALDGQHWTPLKERPHA